MRGSRRTAWILGGVLWLSWSCPAAVYSDPRASTTNVYSWLSATQVVGLTASSAAHGGLLSPASAALSTSLTSLYGSPLGDRSLQTPLLNSLLVGVPVDTTLPPDDLQEAANTSTGLGFGNSTGLHPSAGGQGLGSTGMHRSAGGARKSGTTGGPGGSGGGGHHGGSGANSHRSSQPGKVTTGTGHPVPAKH